MKEICWAWPVVIAAPSTVIVPTLATAFIESVIAASVFAVAWNNLRPFLKGRAWALALGFGLVHGLGFAGALAQLGLRTPKGSQDCAASFRTLARQYPQSPLSYLALEFAAQLENAR